MITEAWRRIAERFYEYFEQQWSITDFGISVMFDQESDPAQRKVIGLGAGKLDPATMRWYPKVNAILATYY